MVLFLLLLYSALVTSVAEAAPCPQEFARIVSHGELAPDASLTEIQAAYRKLESVRRRLGSPAIDGRRFINQSDWEKALAGDPRQPWKYYGKEVMRDWLSGLRFVQADANGAPLDLELLQKLHRITTQSLPFHGFEGRRIRQRLDRGEITRDEFRTLLVRAYEGNEEVSGVPHAKLRGKLRSEEADQIWHAGSSSQTGVGRVFTAEELTAMRGNAYLRVDEAKLKKVGPDAWDGRAYYTDVSQVEGATRAVLSRANAQLGRARSPDEALLVIIRLEKDLISIHPFLDGNGRTVRLAGDLLRRRNGLPPPLYPNEADLTMSEADAFEFHRRAMIDYVNEWTRRLERKGHLSPPSR